jgi:AmiR/NasT family two-component response regulator
VAPEGERQLALELAAVARELVGAGGVHDTLLRMAGLAREIVASCDHAVASMFAAHAAFALKAVQQQEQLEELNDGRANEDIDLIGQAKGLLTVHEDVSDDEAIAVLRDASRRDDLDLREVAERIIELET